MVGVSVCTQMSPHHASFSRSWVHSLPTETQQGEMPGAPPQIGDPPPLHHSLCPYLVHASLLTALRTPDCPISDVTVTVLVSLSS